MPILVQNVVVVLSLSCQYYREKLSPRLILMKTRDRIEEVGRNIDKNGSFVDDGKKLLNDYITRRIWACTM
jgi:hypothetical protein